MDLVLFEDAMKHIARIVRVIMNSGGHALLGGLRHTKVLLSSSLPSVLPSSASSILLPFQSSLVTSHCFILFLYPSLFLSLSLSIFEIFHLTLLPLNFFFFFPLHMFLCYKFTVLLRPLHCSFYLVYVSVLVFLSLFLRRLHSFGFTTNFSLCFS